MTDLTKTLLRVALHHHVSEANLDLGLQRLTTIIGGDVMPEDLAAAVAQAIAQGLIQDPVRLEEGALQCHWRLALTPAGIAVARGLITSRTD